MDEQLFVQEITLDVYEAPKFEYINAKQGDHLWRVLVITLTDRAKVVQLSSETDTASFRALKPDGTSVDNPAAIDESGRLIVHLSRQTLAVPGDVEADVCVQRGEDVISSATFFIQVDKAPLGKNIDSTNEFLVLVEATEAAKQATADTKAATQRADEATGAMLELAESVTEAESQRQEAETARQEAEETRQSEHTTAMEEAGEATGRANTAAETIEGLTVEAVPVEPGGEATAEVSDVDGHKHVVFGIPSGERGEQGPPGIGDMQASVYDPEGRRTDLYKYVDDKLKDVKVEVDETPTEGSDNPVSSGGTAKAIAAATSRTWEVTVQPTAWVASTETWAGYTAAWSAEVQAEGVTAATYIKLVNYISGDRPSYDAVAWLDTGEGTITLYAPTKPTAEFTAAFTEVR